MNMTLILKQFSYINRRSFWRLSVRNLALLALIVFSHIGFCDDEVDKINSALAKSVSIAKKTWKEKQTGASINVEAMTQEIKKQMGDKATAEQVKQEADAALINFMTFLSDKMWEPGDLKILEIIDLSKIRASVEAALAKGIKREEIPNADLIDIVDYFQDTEAGNAGDVGHIRLLLVDNPYFQEGAKYLDRKTPGNKLQGIDFSGDALTQYLDAVHEKIYFAKDVILVDEKLYREQKELSLLTIVREIRMCVDQNNDTKAFQNYYTQQAGAFEKVADEKSPFSNEQANLFINTKEFHVHITAEEPLTRKNLENATEMLKQLQEKKKNPKIEEDIETVSVYIEALNNKLKEPKKTGLAWTKQRLQLVYPVYENDYAKRALTEAARFARMVFVVEDAKTKEVVCTWDTEKFQEAMLRDLPMLFLQYHKPETFDKTTVEVEKFAYCTAVPPVIPYLVDYMAARFEDAQKPIPKD
jgi:hypothetical protein